MVKSPFRNRLIAGAVVATLMLGALFGVSDARDLWLRLREISLAWSSLAAALALLSFLFMAATQRSLLAALQHRVPFFFMVRASWLSLAVSRILRSGGLSSIVVIAWLLRMRGIPPPVSASMKLGEFFLTTVVFALLFVTGAVLLAAPEGAQDGWPDPYFAVPAIGAVGLLLLLILLWRAFVVESRRRVWADRAGRLAAAVGRLFRRRDWGELALTVIDTVSRTCQGLLSNPLRIVPAQGWAVLRVAASAATTWACAKAAHLEVDAATILLAWSLSKLAAIIVIVPAGLGIIEASLTGVLAAMGAPYEAALLTALLNRITYHLIPTTFAIVMAGPLLTRARAAIQEAPFP